MSKVFSALVLASAFALLVPDNRAQAVATADLLPLPAAATGHAVAAAPSVISSADTQHPVSPEASWLLALGFLGAVVARRLRVD